MHKVSFNIGDNSIDFKSTFLVVSSQCHLLSHEADTWGCVQCAIKHLGKNDSVQFFETYMKALWAWSETKLKSKHQSTFHKYNNVIINNFVCSFRKWNELSLIILKPMYYQIGAWSHLKIHQAGHHGNKCL